MIFASRHVAVQYGNGVAPGWFSAEPFAICHPRGAAGKKAEVQKMEQIESKDYRFLCLRCFSGLKVWFTLLAFLLLTVPACRVI